MVSRTVTDPWASVVDWTAGHFDVISLGELAALGIPRSRRQSWVRSGRLHPLFPGVWVAGRPAPRPEGRWRGAVIGCPATTVLSHHTAGSAHGLAVPPAPAVHVTTTSRARSVPGRIVHRAVALDPRDLGTLFAIACTTQERTLVDLADVLTYAELRRVFDKLRRLDLARLAAARTRAGKRRGSPKLTELVERDEPHTRSELERRYLRFAVDRGIRRPDRINTRRHGYEIDCVYEAERVAVELDGRAFHTRGEQVRADHRRDADLHLKGWISHRLVWEELNSYEAAATAERLSAVLASRR